MRNLILLSCCSLLYLACGNAGNAGNAGDAASASPSSSANLYDEGLRKQPCVLLTHDMVATLAKVPTEQLEQREMAGMCLYSWDGGKANIAFIKAYESIEKARTRFENGHKSMTGAEVKAAMGQIGEATKEKLEGDAKAGKQVPDSEHVDPVLGAMAGSMGGGITFEAVEGLGDLAAFETTRYETKILDRVLVSYANKLDVLIGNLSFDVSFGLDEDASDAKTYLDENIALARAVIDGLPE